ncbi:unnamed protein product [Lampetra fluviatilis]
MAWPLANQSAAAIVEAFVQGYVLDKGAPERLLTDQGAPGVTGSRPTTPAGDAEGLATSATDSLCDEHLPANDLQADDLPAAPVPCDGPAARTRAKMRRLL